MSAESSARQVALAAFREWQHSDRFADTILHKRLHESRLTSADRAFATELLYGVLRNLRLLDFWISELRSGALDNHARDVLRLGLYQLLMLKTAEHAAVYETVELSQRRARDVVNGVLRSAQQRKAEFRAAMAALPTALRTSHPDFLVTKWTSQFGAKNTARLCEWNNEPPPIFARVNQLKSASDEFATEHPDAPPVADYPGFFRCRELPLDAVRAGNCYIQDPSTAVACELLDAQPGETILDACAAPGGKTSYLAQAMQNRGNIIAADRDPPRIAMLQQNLKLLGVANTEVIECDWTENERRARVRTPAAFDRILLDAPCSNTGVMRRRVDVRWRLTASDFLRMQRQQLAIAKAVLPLLKAGGVFVYSTCSIEPEENDEVVSLLLTSAPELRLEQTQQRLPFRDEVDGAFAARFTIAR